MHSGSSDEDTWIEAFLRARGSDAGTVSDREALGRQLADVVQRARARWPRLDLDPVRYVAYLAQRLPEDGGVDPALTSVDTDDLWLACACVEGNAAAQSAFEREHTAAIDRIIGHMQLGDATVDEVKQAVRTKLLVAKGDAPPKIADYRGRGDLRSWVGVIATREALTLLRSQGRHPAAGGDEQLMAMESPAVGPELDFLKEHYRDAFKDAFQGALGELSPKARNALRHHYVHGLTIDQLGSMYGVHRSNAARRIANARDSLLSGTRRRLVHGLRVDRAEFDSIMRLIESRLDLSIRRLLGDETEAGNG